MYLTLHCPPAPSCANYKSTVDSFEFAFLVTAPIENAGSFRVVTGGTGCDDYTSDLSGLVTVPSTGGWDNFVYLSA